MTILVNYLYTKIFEIILNFIYITKETKEELLSVPRYIYNNQEVLQYSLVNKFCFNSISNILEKNILRFKNYEALKSLIKDSKFSLIKLKNSVIVFRTMGEYKEFIANNDIRSFRKVLLHSSERTLRSILSSNEKFPENVHIILFLTILPNSIDYHEETLSSENLKEIKSKININTLYVFGLNNSTDLLLERISKLNAKSIILNSYKTSMTPSTYPNLSVLMKNPCIRSIDLESWILQPNKVLDINDSSLKSLSLGYDLHYKDLYNQGTNIDTIFIRLISSWDVVESSLCSYKKIQRFKIKGDIFKSNLNAEQVLKFGHYNCKRINSILTNKTINIEILLLNQFEETNSNLFIDGLLRNKTIKKLEFFVSNPNQIIQKVLPFNKTIRNIFITQGDNLEEIISFLKTLAFTKNIELFSVSIYLNTNVKKDLKKIFNCLISNSFFYQSINEFNFYVKIQFQKYHSSFKSQVILNNPKTIFNFYFYK
ncbi:hypothetical protein DICPUDRAFT_85248 [Dictyostelium purpureum]|uniref:Uncharacterized protein n=1 Tax=Dictyostelium purpureum TaxID=5786 RepID=F1A561_DICPU|nr:uncharacterized protein DICPUDRAFT_85248 [Dictyostelium purpureum]EGC28668.1 hypothetical protein DICPUDRAFT_85248 [Dictyostelium purpureum]|eukprot:XP_003294806.1 hypothetical protein DICPUDRAFT_85248 [Dictyostelium purpureum]